MKENWTVLQVAEHIVEQYKLTPREIGELIDELIRLRYNALKGELK